MSLPEGTKIQLLAPVVKEEKAVIKGVGTSQESGYVRAFIDSQLRELSEEIVLERTKNIILILLLTG